MAASYLGIADVLALHIMVMERLGFSPQPLRDMGALESAIMRPRTAAHYEGASLLRQAVLLATGISQAQAFLDGNERTALIALDTFLLINGIEVTGDPLEFARQLGMVAEALTNREQAVAAFESWIAANAVVGAS